MLSCVRPRLTQIRPRFAVLGWRHESGDASQASGRLNQKIRLDEPIVRDTVETSEIQPGKRVALCRCWQSNKFPLCDGAHKVFNEKHGDNLGPVIVIVPKE